MHARWDSSAQVSWFDCRIYWAKRLTRKPAAESSGGFKLKGTLSSGEAQATTNGNDEAKEENNGDEKPQNGEAEPTSNIFQTGKPNIFK